jgi:hypothetical protein
MMNLVNVPAGWFQTGWSFRRSGVGQGIFVVDLTGHYLNSILERRTVELQEKTAELEKLCVAQYE